MFAGSGFDVFVAVCLLGTRIGNWMRPIFLFKYGCACLRMLGCELHWFPGAEQKRILANVKSLETFLYGCRGFRNPSFSEGNQRNRFYRWYRILKGSAHARRNHRGIEGIKLPLLTSSNLSRKRSR